MDATLTNAKDTNTPLSRIRFNDGKSLNLCFRSIAVRVGPEDDSRTFDLDQGLLAKHSGFFASIRSGPWRESQDRSVKLVDDDPDIFSTFALFIHTGKIFSTREGDIEVYADGSRRDLEWARLARAWVLGDKLQATPFKDAVADAICDKIVLDQKWPITLHQIIYPRTTAAARGIRRLCADIAVTKWESRILKNTVRDEGWNEFFEDVAMRLHATLKQGKGTEIDFERSGCRYHEHVVEGTGCWKTMEFLSSGR